MVPRKTRSSDIALEWRHAGISVLSAGGFTQGNLSFPSPRAEEGCSTDTGRKPLLGSEPLLRFDGATGEEAKLGPLVLHHLNNSKGPWKPGEGALCVRACMCACVHVCAVCSAFLAHLAQQDAAAEKPPGLV